jgi:hypothetical protein
MRLDDKGGVRPEQRQWAKDPKEIGGVGSRSLGWLIHGGVEVTELSDH